MSCTQNVTKGKQLVLLIRNAGDTAYEIAGGVRERGFSLASPTEEVTSSSTTTNFTESESTGYKQLTMNVSGVADSRTGTDPITSLNIVGSERLLEIAFSESSCGKFKMLNLDTNGYIEGFFNVTSFDKTGSTPGLLNFTATFESKSDITRIGAP